MAHTPREIRRKTFPLQQRGFEPAAVVAYLGELADQIEAAARQDRFHRLGREVEVVLRTAHEQGARIRAEAARAAEKVAEDAALYALERKREADRDREEAERLLAQHREQAAAIVRTAEEQAAAIVRSAETLAGSRRTQQRTADRPDPQAGPRSAGDDDAPPVIDLTGADERQADGTPSSS